MMPTASWYSATVGILPSLDVMAANSALAKNTLVFLPKRLGKLRVLVDTKDIKSADKRWNWVRRGAPVVIEIGPRDMTNGVVTFMRRDQLRDGDKVRSHSMARDRFVSEAAQLLTEIQVRLYSEAKTRLDGNIKTAADDPDHNLCQDVVNTKKAAAVATQDENDANVTLMDALLLIQKAAGYE